MTGKELFQEIGNIADDFVMEAENYRKSRRVTPMFRKTLALAACFCVCLVLAAGVYMHKGYDMRADSVEEEENTAMAGESIMEYSLSEPETSMGTGLPEEYKETFSGAEADGGQNELFTTETGTEAASEKLESAMEENAVNQIENAYVILHGKVECGQELWDAFYHSVNDGQEAQIDIIQFTIEGDAIIDYVRFDGSSFWFVSDISRDAFKGCGEVCYDETYQYLIKTEQELEDGRKYVEYVLSNTKDDAEDGRVLVAMYEEEE